MKWLVDRLMILAVLVFAGWYFTPKTGLGPVRLLTDTVYQRVPGDTMKLGCVLDTAQWIGVSDPQWISYKRNGFPDSTWVLELYAPVNLLAKQALERAWLHSEMRRGVQR